MTGTPEKLLVRVWRLSAALWGEAEELQREGRREKYPEARREKWPAQLCTLYLTTKYRTLTHMKLPIEIILAT